MSIRSYIMGLRLAERVREPKTKPARKAPARALGEAAANAVRQQVKPPAMKPDPQAAAARLNARQLIASTLLAEGVAAARVPALLDTFETSGLQGLEPVLRREVKVPQLARATAERIAARGDIVFLDADAFTEHHLALGSSVEHVATLLGDIEAAPGVPVPTYARRFGHLEAEHQAEKSRIAATLNAEAAVMEQHWGGRGAAVRPAAGAAPAPRHSGYFHCDAPSGFRRAQEGESNGH